MVCTFNVIPFFNPPFIPSRNLNRLFTKGHVKSRMK
jgi:hypothetical protein